MSTALEALDTEIAQAERRAAEAFAQQRAMGSTVSTSEAIAVGRTVKALDEKLAALKSRRFEVAAGVEPPAAPPPPPPRTSEAEIAAVVAKALGRETAERLKAQRTDMEAHVAASCAAVRDEFDGKLAKGLDTVKWGLNHTIDQKVGRSATELLKHREIREATQAELRLQLLDVRKEVLELREALAQLRAAGNGSGHAF
jgi:hypothetical protein